MKSSPFLPTRDKSVDQVSASVHSVEMKMFAFANVSWAVGSKEPWLDGLASFALDATPKFPNIPVSLQGNTKVPGVSREVPCSVLKCETVLDTLDATEKFPRHAGFPRGEHRGSRHHFICAPSPCLIATG